MCFDETFTRQFDIAKELCIYLTGNICLIHRRIYISLRLCSWILSGWIIPWNELFQFSLCIFELYSRGIILSYFYFYYSILNNLMYTYIYIRFISLLFQSHDEAQNSFSFRVSSNLPPLTCIKSSLFEICSRNLLAFLAILPSEKKTMNARKDGGGEESHKSKPRKQLVPEISGQLAPNRETGYHLQNFERRFDTWKSWIFLLDDSPFNRS